MGKNICSELLKCKYANEQISYLIIEENHMTCSSLLNQIRNYCQTNKADDTDYNKLMAIYYYILELAKEKNDKTNTKWYKNLISIINYKYTDPHELYVYMTDTLDFPIYIFNSYINSYKKYFPQNKQTYQKLLEISDILQKQKKDSIKIKHMESSQRIIINLSEEACKFAENFINSYMPLGKYLSKNSIPKPVAKKYRDSLKITNKELYIRFLENVKLKETTKKRIS